MTNKQRKNKINLLTERLKKYTVKLAYLKAECKHKIKQRGDSAVCDICNKNFGWWCPKSENHYCIYTDYANFQLCFHCQEPSERK